MKQGYDGAMNGEVAAYVEQVGRFWEGIIGSRVAGRILGWLMICDPPAQSAADLMEALDVSAGSVSTQVRTLQSLGLVERVTFPGDRVSYFQMPDQAWTKVMDKEAEQLEAMRALAAQGEKLAPASRPDRVRDLGIVADFFHERWPALMEELSERLERT